jgi:hypothetical protein
MHGQRVARCLFALATYLLFSASTNAQTTSPLRVDEGSMRAAFQAGGVSISLPITNKAPVATAVTIRVDLLKPDDAVIATQARSLRLPSGASSQSILVPDGQARYPNGEYLWTRVRYQLVPEGAEGEVSGLVALGAIAPGLFALEVAYPREARAGVAYQLYVHAANPVTHRPVAGVQVSGVLKPDEGETEIPAAAEQTTDSAGQAVLRWTPDRTGESSSGEIAVRGRKGSIEKTVSVDATFSLSRTFILSTDKPIYQPGQALHIRALLFDHRKHAVGGTAVRLTLSDPDNAVLFRSTTKTDRFGVASVDWSLPDAVRLGDYDLEAELPESSNPDEPRHASTVRITRYDLPTFTVSLSADRRYYLPGQDAVLAVDAKYLFGRAVSAGSVRVVREAERHWNFKKQTWESEEEDQRTAELDASGHATVTLPLSKALAGLVRADRNDYRDVTCAAYVTDKSSGRTEQRRIDLRVSRDPIHIYVTGGRLMGGKASLYVTAAYPDGEAAEVSLQIGQRQMDGPTRVLRSLRTNRFGAAKIAGLELDLEGGPPRQWETRFVVDARDKAGRHATLEWPVSYLRTQSVVVATDKTVYRLGEPVTVSITSSRSGRVVLDAVSDGNTLWTTSVAMNRGRGFVVVPYREQFLGLVSFVARDLGAGSRYGAVDHRTVVYPHDTDLRVRVQPARSSYAPGDQFKAAVRVISAAGAAAESALGVTMVDKAVDERARTDRDFEGSKWGFWNWGWWRSPARVGSLTLQALVRQDVTGDISEDLDLAAEVLLDAEWVGWDLEIEDDDLEGAIRWEFQPRVERDLAGANKALRAAAVLPSNDRELRATLGAAGISEGRLLDPWGSVYAFRYDLDIRNRTITAISAGPDKRPDTDDDLVALTVAWNHFTPYGTAIDRAVKRVHERTGGYIRDFGTLAAALLEEGLALESIRDPWGAPYKIEFDIDGYYYRILVRSTRPRETAARNASSDVVWTSSIDYFERPRADIDKVCAGFWVETGHLPRTDAELDEALRRAASNFHDLRDPWGNPYFVKSIQSFEYGQEYYYSADLATRPIGPVTQAYDHVTVISAGPDGKQGTWDDVPVAFISQAVSTQRGRDQAPRPAMSAPVAGDTGAIEGVATDRTGGVLPGVTIRYRLERGGGLATASTDSNGRFRLSDLGAGMYRVQVELPGFKSLTVRFVPVEVGRATRLEIVLDIGGLTEAVMVTGARLELQTQSSATVLGLSSNQPGGTTAAPQQTFTPRIRDYFPETLYWAPSLVTSSGGAATISVKLADTITTWKLGVIASTTTGEIGYSETEVEAFQPFFVEHDPPKVLTTGDQIELPVVVRNYLGHAEQARVDLAPAPWFTSRGATTQTVSVPPAGYATAVFPFTAMTAVSAGRQRVGAVSQGVGDSVDKPVTVHPDGEEGHVTAAGLLRDTAKLEMALPGDLLPGSLSSTIRIYPNLLSHVVEGVEAALVRPYGCGEQTISSAYPSLLLLKYYKTAGIAGTPVTRKAASYARAGLDRLLTYRTLEGGFGYWGARDPDVALTAYAARFLADASDILPVDAGHVAAAASWLVSRQAADGTWQPRYGDDETLTAQVASALAHVVASLPEGETRTKVLVSIRRSTSRLPSARQPYTVAQLALAAWDAGMRDEARAAAERLKTLSHDEGRRTYWVLDTNTPFYSWGLAGRIETTAVAVEALETIEGGATPTPLVDGGIAFLLGEKDRYGIWYSGHTTVDVLSALLHAIGQANRPPAASRVVVVVNGQPSLALELPAGTGSGPVMKDLGTLLRPGANTIELRRDEGVGQYASVQVVSTFYVPWTRATDTRETVRTGDSRGLRMAVNFDKMTARVGEEIRASVEVERVGHRGYGMLLAEVGLPPGADVDRASLEKAVAEGGWDLCRYEVQPDRVVLYVWPRAGGTRVSFTFRPRFEMVAKSAASSLYDYYNPDEQATLPPAVFTVVAASGAPEAPKGSRRR